ncbi:MAG TPA: UrcA family protein [Allosphingosinicella sp.]|nr:UrcA family protein [Allosphingosinicella sp.]
MARIYPRFAALALAAAFAVSGGTLAAFAAPAAAADIVVTGSPAPTAKVAYDDLDLGSAAGLNRLNARIRAAADRLCSDPGVKGLEAQLQAAACRDATIAAAAPQVARAIAQSGFASAAPIVLASGR